MIIYTVIGHYAGGEVGSLIRSFKTRSEADTFKQYCEGYDMLPQADDYTDEAVTWEANHPASNGYLDGYAVIEHELMGGDV